MKNGRFAKRGAMGKTLVLMLSLVLIVGCVTGGTLAWLTAKTNDVTNTFTESDIGVELRETTGRKYKMVPGWVIDKDPKAAVTADSEDCYLFVRVVENGGAVTYTDADGNEVTTVWSDFLAYEIAEPWTLVPGTADVYYMEFDSGVTHYEKVTAYSILKDDQVTVRETVTKEMMDAITEENRPALTFTAYAVQLDNSNATEFTPEQAWAKVDPAPVNP